MQGISNIVIDSFLILTLFACHCHRHSNAPRAGPNPNRSVDSFSFERKSV